MNQSGLTNAVPPQPPARVTRAVTRAARNGRKQKPRPGPIATGQDLAIERILRLVKKGNCRSLRVEAAVKKMEQKLEDALDEINNIQVMIARK